MSLASAPAPAVSAAHPVPIEYELLCEQCGYSLLGLFSDRCPECGKPFDPTELPLARVPWLYRARLGRVSAYVQTVAMILRRPRQFAREMCRPVRVSAPDARSFRRVTVRFVVATYLFYMTGLAIYGIRDVMRMGIPFPTAQVAMAGAIAAWGAVMLTMSLTLATDLPTFIWRGLPASPDDLAPLHHYACAPLALVPLLAVLGGAGWLVYSMAPGRTSAHVLAYSGFALGLIVLLLVWWLPPVLMRAATGCGVRRMLALGAYLPLHWAMMLALGGMLVLIPFAYLGEWLEM
jgi:hypothetical protein